MGMKKELEFECADSWLLLAIIYAYQRADSSLSNIIGYGDFINHAIFSLEEIQGGISRLIKSGYVVEKNKEFFPTDKILISYKKLPKKNTVLKELEFIRTELKAPIWSENYNSSKANLTSSYNGVKKEDFEKAYKKYTQKTGTH